MTEEQKQKLIEKKADELMTLGSQFDVTIVVGIYVNDNHGEFVNGNTIIALGLCEKLKQHIHELSK